MKKNFCATIVWKTFEQGGRKNVPPEGTRYCPLIKLNENELWSVDFICPDYSKCNIINFSMLSNDAPIELIVKGKIYNLYEGQKLVASICVIQYCGKGIFAIGHWHIRIMQYCMIGRNVNKKEREY